MKELPASKNYDAVIIGAGHNGLVTAAYLAKAGYRVLVAEQREHVGGAASRTEIFPGYELDVGAVIWGWKTKACAGWKARRWLIYCSWMGAG
jgi:flavin-dependent dehydrogenase